ncbi:hypothetical protein MANES_12G077701v8 [Manihot esculenta]|uniref:Uncharacterized protein n=2 Tax=Manihot esculenta TaxID=3983 RepID=A0ACB7GRP8_MANES|nr:hypothetical protein MANES_12G077701v8 [Manihot esculenta]
MARLGNLVFLVLTAILMVQAVAHDDYEPNSSQLQVQSGVESNGLVDRVADQPASSSLEESRSPSPSDEWKEAEAPEIRRMGKHHSSDKSVAGGGVIIGGLVTAIFAAVFCYIRVTRKKENDGVLGR